MKYNIYDIPAGSARSITQEEYDDRFIVKDQRKRALRYQHKCGIDPAAYLAALESQDYRCATCATPEGNMWNKLEPDYNPATRKLYALVCKPCSQTLATAKRDPALLRSLADHAERYAKE